MTAPPSRHMGHLSASELRSRLSGPRVTLDYGACRVRVRSVLSGFGEALQRVYRAFPLEDDEPFADFHVEVMGGRVWRAAVGRPQCRFRIDGVEPFEPFSAANALPHFEWGVNWCFANRFHQYCLLHAGALALGANAVVMAAVPGSGKSTLSAAMMLNGWRLLSDEFGVLNPETGQLLAMLKPVALKNQSIDVIRAFSADAVVGPTFHGTRKGDVAHLAPNDASVAARHVPAYPRVVIFPRYRAGAALRVERLAPEPSFARLAFNSFNYALLGSVSFNAVADVVKSCPAFEIEYGSLNEAVECVRGLMAAEGVA